MPAALTDSHQATDAALAARVACGEAAALDPLYRRHKAPVYRFALLWSGAAAVAADVTQDVFVHLLTQAGDFDPASFEDRYQTGEAPEDPNLKTLWTGFERFLLGRFPRTRQLVTTPDDPLYERRDYQQRR